MNINSQEVFQHDDEINYSSSLIKADGWDVNSKVSKQMELYFEKLLPHLPSAEELINWNAWYAEKEYQLK